MKDVRKICESELESMLAFWQVEGDLGLSFTVVKAFSIDGRNRQLLVEFRGIHVDQKMMMSCIRKVGPCRAHAHSFKSETNRDGSFEGPPVLDSLNVNAGSLGRGCLKRVRRLRSVILTGSSEERPNNGNSGEK